MPVTPLHNVIDREGHKKYFCLPLYGNSEDSLMTACTPTIDESQ